MPIDVGLVLKPWGRQCYDAILSKELLDQQPFAARAQPVKTHLLAILTHIDAVDRTTGQQARYWTAFFNQLRDLGYEEGSNLAVTWHSSQVDAERAADLVRRVAERKPDVIFTPDARIAMFLKTMAAAIPAVAITVPRRDSRATTRG